MEKMSKIRIALHLTRFDQGREISQVLTDTQKAKWKAMRKKQMEKRMMRHKKKRGHESSDMGM